MPDPGLLLVGFIAVTALVLGLMLLFWAAGVEADRRQKPTWPERKRKVERGPVAIIMPPPAFRNRRTR